MIVDTLLTPAEFTALSTRDLHNTTCVVIDVLRATSSMLTAFANGATDVRPVAEISEALALKKKYPDALLAGERNGVRIERSLTGSIDFDLGNSPRDFSAENISGRSIIWSTTNGTRALRACAHASTVLLGALLNLEALADLLERLDSKRVLLVCAGTIDAAAFEDIFTAGELIESLVRRGIQADCSDASHVAWRSFRDTRGDHAALIQSSANAQKLLGSAVLRDDVEVCLQTNRLTINAQMAADGIIRLCR
jgi:2-phosphosulfolactate phosphatase